MERLRVQIYNFQHCCLDSEQETFVFVTGTLDFMAFKGVNTAVGDDSCHRIWLSDQKTVYGLWWTTERGVGV